MFFYLDSYLHPNQRSPIDITECRAKWKIMHHWCTERMGRPPAGREDLSLYAHAWREGLTVVAPGIPRGIYIRDDEDIVAFKLTFGDMVNTPV